jgi:hypothetical protein
VKDLRSLLAELSSSWLKRRKAQAPDTVNMVKAAPRPANDEATCGTQAQTTIHPRRRLKHVSPVLQEWRKRRHRKSQASPRRSRHNSCYAVTGLKTLAKALSARRPMSSTDAPPNICGN